MPHETTYERADELLDEARGYLPVDGAVPDPGHDPVARARGNGAVTNTCFATCLRGYVLANFA